MTLLHPVQTLSVVDTEAESPCTKRASVSTSARGTLFRAVQRRGPGPRGEKWREMAGPRVTVQPGGRETPCDGGESLAKGCCL